MKKETVKTAPVKPKVQQVILKAGTFHHDDKVYKTGDALPRLSEAQLTKLKAGGFID